MKTELDHLPEAKRRELQRVVEILFAEFQDAIALGAQAHKKQGRILKVILYGSYARGDWVDDPVGGYKSDYDLLVVVNHDRLTDMVEYWAKAEDHLMREMTIDRRLTAPVSLIVHTVADVNAQLKRGRPFFVDIVRDGIALYEAPGHEFVRPEPLSPAEAFKEAQGYFDEWFPSASGFQRNAGYALRDGDQKLAAFLLHQTAERLWHCVLLTLTLYSPKSHKLNFLRSQAEQLDARLVAAWPRRAKFEQRCFELLRRAYVDARYSPHYNITTEELAWLGERITALQALVKQVCEDRLDVLRANV
ncbi:HEPN domain-containing protein [Phenylobacterium montanum]|uniref:HEPN domain-containing protein n=1 Tax=Phenylobacterium montanum TaxID=2823693 RepID=A0A975G3J7_9CAUL|nr:HEPN domain-containing protein [Caulobacter sp. S6]QUD90154.1 HEPN domain-containing protein [Caulobacter sp. S6]